MDIWPMVPFNEAVDVNPTVCLKAEQDYPFVSMASIAPLSKWVVAPEKRKYSQSGSRFSHGDTLMARITPCLENGKIARYRAPHDSLDAHGSTEFIVIRGRAGVSDSDFAYYLTQLDEFQNHAVSHMTGTSGRQRLPVDCLNSILVPLPAMDDQLNIVRLLNALDDKIELNQSQVTTLETVALALFKSWFVDFRPVKDKYEGRDCALPTHITDMFPEDLIDSELGPMPRAWSVGILREIAETVTGRSYKSSDLAHSDTALVTLKSFKRGGGYRSDGLKPYTGLYRLEQEVHPGEVVVSCTDVSQTGDVIDRPAIVEVSRSFRVLVASLDVLIVRPISDLFTPTFLFLLMCGRTFVAHTGAHSSGTTVLHLDKASVLSYRFVRPPPELISYYNNITQPIFRRIQLIQQETELLVTLRNRLLPGLITGWLRTE